MADFKPGFPDLAQTVAPGVVGENTGFPKVRLPEVGDTMNVIVSPWGHFEVQGTNTSVSEGAQVVQVEVKAIKTAKLVLE